MPEVFWNQGRIFSPYQEKEGSKFMVLVVDGEKLRPEVWIIKQVYGGWDAGANLWHKVVGKSDAAAIIMAGEEWGNPNIFWLPFPDPAKYEGPKNKTIKIGV